MAAHGWFHAQPSITLKQGEYRGKHEQNYNDGVHYYKVKKRNKTYEKQIHDIEDIK